MIEFRVVTRTGIHSRVFRADAHGQGHEGTGTNSDKFVEIAIIENMNIHADSDSYLWRDLR
jgi:hypothetical protein